MEPTSPWKRPNEVMQLHRLKKRKKALQDRMKQPLTPKDDESPRPASDVELERLLGSDKRKNPFSKQSTQENKKLKTEETPLDESSDTTLFALMNLPAKIVKPPKNIESDKLSTFSNLLQKFTAEHTIEPDIIEKKHNYLPIDWALKTKLRLMSPKPFPWSQQLKASEEASGITGFVRCLDTSASPTLDTSPRARFHQSCLYWQHPQLPWLPLFPRGAGRVAATGFLAANEDAKAALHREWTESFRSLFQLLRARHCPYFYVCANTFTALFCAGGVCGAEPVACVTPTTRGLRATLRQEDVEFTMPLRSDSRRKLNSSDSKDETPRNSSHDSCYDTMDAARSPAQDESPDEDADSDKFMTEMGLENDVIKKIMNRQTRVQQAAECSVDSAAESLACVRGADAQLLFNFLLNCRSATAAAGPWAAVPPTLLAPVAFHGGALHSLKVRETCIYSDNRKYHSVELRGPVLPSAAQALLRGLRAPSAAHFSATFAHHAPTVAFTAAARRLAEEAAAADGEPGCQSQAFNKENLSDCGLSHELLDAFCSPPPDRIQTLDSVKCNEDGTYSW